MQYGFLFNGKRCTGCKTCVMACKDYHDLSTQTAFRQVYECAGGTWEQDEDGIWKPDVFAYYVSLSCNHCANPACIKVCPSGAMHKDDMGIVSVDVKRCIGCGYCSLVCPYRAPRVDRAVGHSSKCDLCKDRLVQGKKPICVEACPLRALDFGEIDELRRIHDGNVDIAPLPSSRVTGPNLVVIPSRHARPSDEGSRIITNANELV